MLYLVVLRGVEVEHLGVWVDPQEGLVGQGQLVVPHFSPALVPALVLVSVLELLELLQA